MDCHMTVRNPCPFLPLFTEQRKCCPLQVIEQKNQNGYDHFTVHQSQVSPFPFVCPIYMVLVHRTVCAYLSIETHLYMFFKTSCLYIMCILNVAVCVNELVLPSIR